jgi:hypothetical protein
MSLPEPVEGTARLFSSQATGWQVQLPAWRYPVVCDTTSGQLHYDNFEGRWGDPKKLDQFLQAFAVEKATLEARKQGYSVQESALADGSIQLLVEVGGQV